MSGPGQSKATIQYDGSFQTADLDLQKFSAGTPVYQDPDKTIAVNGKMNWLRTSEPIPYPQNLYDVEIGASWTGFLEGQRFWSAQASFGSASDRPFASSDVDVINVTGSYGFPGGQDSNWVLLLNYSNNRPILNNIPLPGFAYIYHPSKEFTATLGVPFAMVAWRPAPRWLITAFTVVPWVLKTEVGYFVAGPVRAFSAFDFSQELYLLKSRPERADRLYYDGKRVSVGVKSPLSTQVSAELAAGYAFDRSFFQGKTYSDRNQNPTRLSGTWFFSTGLRASF